jgi:hypothetical protein
VSRPPVERAFGLADGAGAVTGQVQALRGVAERLLRRHGTGVQDQQAQLKRLAHAAIEAYAQIATIYWVSRRPRRDDNHPRARRGGGHRQHLCGRAQRRAAQWLRQMDDNDDDAMGTVARAVIDRGGYVHAI